MYNLYFKLKSYCYLTLLFLSKKFGYIFFIQFLPIFKIQLKEILKRICYAIQGRKEQWIRRIIS